jgi:hypothetical protein
MDTSFISRIFSIHTHYINERYNGDIYSQEHDGFIKEHIYPEIIDNIQLELSNYYFENIFKYIISDDKTADDIYSILMDMDIEIIRIFIKYFEKPFMDIEIFIQLIKDLYFDSSEIPGHIVKKCNLFFEKINTYKESNSVDPCIYESSCNLIIDLFNILSILSSSDEYIVRIIRNNIYYFYKLSLYDYFLRDISADDIYNIAIVMDNDLIQMIIMMFESSVNKFEDYIKNLYNDEYNDNINNICLKAFDFFQEILNN